jgi:ferritin
LNFKGKILIFRYLQKKSHMGKKLISDPIEKQLNEQMTREASAAQFYLAMGSWADANGYDGIASFLFHHMEEERAHMMKLLRYINQRGGHCKVEALPNPEHEPGSLQKLFEMILDQEIGNTAEISRIADSSLQAKDLITFNFMMWFIKEQEEEEAMATQLLDKFNLVGNNAGNKGGLYEFDKQLSQLQQDFHLARESNASGEEG